MSFKVQLYGQFSGYLSHATVSRGMAYGLHANRCDVEIWSTNRYGGYEGFRDSGDPWYPSFSAGINEKADVGLWIGGYPHQIRPWLNDHAYKAALVITESSVIPDRWVSELRAVDLVIVPSVWCRNVFQQAGVSAEKLVVCSHGVHPAFIEAGEHPPVPQGPPWRFLHVCGTPDYYERKGTRVLCEAFAKVFGGQTDYQLVLRMPECPAAYELQSIAPKLIQIDPTTPEGLPPAKMVEYLSQGWVAVAQPSRAEAFGLLPREAWTLGVRVIATRCTGHDDLWAQDVWVQHGPDGWMASNHIPNGLAPTVSVVAVESALRSFLHGIQAPVMQQTVAARRRLGWPSVCESLVRRLKHDVAARPKQNTVRSRHAF